MRRIGTDHDLSGARRRTTRGAALSLALLFGGEVQAQGDAEAADAASVRWGWAARANMLRVARYRGRAFLHPVPVVSMGPAVFRARTSEWIPDPQGVRAEKLALARLGLIDEAVDLRQGLEASAAVTGGFYGLRERAIFVPDRRSALSGGWLARWTGWHDYIVLATEIHELTHALADQRFDLHSMFASLGRNEDAQLAFRSLVEGEAMMITEMLEHELRGRGGTAVDLLRRAGSSSRSIAPVRRRFHRLWSRAFTDEPSFIRDRRIFPYVEGLVFVARLTPRGKWSWVDYAFEFPPLSSEQILHPEKFWARPPDIPISIEFLVDTPWGNEWRLLKSNTLGEFGMRQLLGRALPTDTAEAAAAGWGGDTYMVFEHAQTAGRTAMVLATTWDTAEDAAEAARALAARYRTDGPAPAIPAGVQRPVALWSEPDGVCGIWRNEKDLWVFLGMPENLVAPVVKWGTATVKIERGLSWTHHPRAPRTREL